MKITNGTIRRPQRVAIYTPEGFGKSTLGANYPKPLFLDTETGGTDHLDVNRVTIKKYSDAVEAIAFLNKGDHDYQTVVIDTIDWLEKFLVKQICKKHKKSGIEDFGFGKGYTFLAEEFQTFLLSLDELIAKGMNVLALCHSHVKSFTPPDAAQGYDRFELKLSRQCAPLLKEWVDALLFGNYKVRLQERDAAKVRGVGNSRVLHVEHAAAWDAKNRIGLTGSVDFTVAAISDLIVTGETPTDTVATSPAVQAEINKGIPQIAEDMAIVDFVADAKAVINDAIVKRKMDAVVVLAFLEAREVIKPEEKFDAIPESYAKRMIENPDRFLDTVSEWQIEEGACNG